MNIYTKDAVDTLLNAKATVTDLNAETTAREDADATFVTLTNNLNNKLTKKQDTLVSGTNIKTINGESLLGSGDMVISGGGGASVEPTYYANANTQLNAIKINGTSYKLLDIKVNDGSSLVIGGNRSLASGASGVIALGVCASSTASGDFSTALGTNSSASGNSSTAIGRDSKANSESSIALGFASTASGIYSTALGNNATAIGSNSVALGNSSKANGKYSTTLGDNSGVYVPNWVGFDGTTDTLVRTVSLKSTDNVFFRNENVDSTKTTQESYINGKTLTQVLNEKQDILSTTTDLVFYNSDNTVLETVKVYNK